MKTEAVNWLLLRSVGIFCSYCIIGFFTPKPYVSSIIGMGALMVGGMMFVRYIETCYEIIVKQRRGKMGGHIAILGAGAVGFGLVFSGMFRIIWSYYGSPSEWAGTAISSFGLFMIVLGSYLIARAPDAVQVRSRFPSGFWQKTGVLMLIILAFVAGTHFASFQ
ncbi:hypothetical protein [Rhizobium sp. HT1-10]|uniref:hypothetical protein n=1 Tax=Rhizobium sp. HT1-10 TaxID=3111638 RepID=UPI003C1DAF1D